MPISESEVLKPVDPSITDSDDWETFILNDAYVVYESNGKPASLLRAYADTRLKVVGQLAPPARGQSKYYLQKPPKPAEIEIRDVMRYSYGEMTDGEYALWAQGKAGWFEIRPAANYKKIYDEMLQAVEILYFVTDIYNEPRKRGGGPSPQLIFQEYAEDERFLCTDPTIATQIFRQHHMFLMMCFLNRAQGLSWSMTPLYQYFKKQFPEDFNTCKARIEGRFQPEPEPQTRRSKSASVAAKASPSAPAVPQARKGRGTTLAQKTDETPKKNDNWWEAATLFEFMQKLVNKRVLKAGRNQITLERVAQLIVKRYEIEELETAINVLLVHATNLCYMMGHPRRKSVQYFVNEPIYTELMAGHDLPAAEQRRAESVELRPRKDHASLQNEGTESSDTSEDDEDDIKTPVQRLSGRRKKGRLSVLRPKSGKFSGKSKGKGKAPLPKPNISDNNSEDDSEQVTDSEDAMNVDTPTQKLTIGQEKRKHNQTDMEIDSDQPKRPRTASATKTPDSPPTSSASDNEDDTDSTPVHRISALAFRPNINHPQSSTSQIDSAPPTASTLVSTPLPTYQANGSRDSWICDFDGCTQRIYGCSKLLGQQLITEHLEDHAKGREKFVGILWREQDKLHLPVSNLIKKIREMSEATSQLFPLGEGEKAVPAPVERPVQ